jgi:hypothetical protein
VDWRTFVADLVKSAAWPTTIFVLVILFRRELSEVISGLTGLRYKDFEVKFGRQLEASKVLAENAQLPIPERPQYAFSGAPELRFPDEVRNLAYRSPREAVLEAWLLLEEAARVRLEVEGLEVPKNGAKTIQLIEQNELLSGDAVKLFHKLRQLRNEVVHDRTIWMSPQLAEEFVLIAERLYAALKKDTGRRQDEKSVS